MFPVGERKCNKYGCDGTMRPTRAMYTCGGAIKNPTHRIFKCVKCGKENPWVDKPYLNGSFAQLHMIKDVGHSCLSMMSDPKCYTPKEEK